ncbi:MAG: biotin-dependent carboxyltransferase family protein [Rhodothermales bacterium]|nr:biotin-dependent carboxyltransferase family protein [Rhodothermales bacterium]MBO6778322.1 biotin-dependent carboxyltransferase family protein [Rhodothermales bacterium]
MTAVIHSPGTLTTIQDLGRMGQARRGLAPGGPMDREAFLWANRLLANPINAPLLEVAFGGLTVQFMDDGLCALTGADCTATLDDERIAPWSAVRVQAGQTLSLRYAADGNYAYLAFPGGLVAPRFLGSASVVMREGVGLSPVRAGDELRWEGGNARPARVRPEVHARSETAFAFLPGYEWGRFSEEDQHTFLHTGWTIQPSSNRIARHLSGAQLASGPRVLDSVPLVDGTVQVPPSGRPLVFMRDRPTIGGYAKLGSVSPRDLDRLAQIRPGEAVRFKLGNPEVIRRVSSSHRSFFELR